MPTASRFGTKTTKTTKVTNSFFRSQGRLVLADHEIPAIPAEIEQLGRRVIGCRIAVHRAFGPGYKESIYLEALCIEMDSRGIGFEREKQIKVHYKERQVGTHRLDLLVDGVLVVECKVADCLSKIHERQVTSYLKATKLRLGFVFNFNVAVLMPDGFKRIALEAWWSL